MRSHIERGLARAEQDTEALLAVLRLLVFSAITAVFWAGGALEHAHMAMFSFVALGAFATASLALAWIGFFRPWLPWVFATLDVGLLLHCVGPLAMAFGSPASGISAAPGTSLIFLLLAIAAVRHRPYLVLYTAGLFVAGWALLWITVGAQAPDAAFVLPGEITRLSVVALTAVVLFVAVGRTRRALADAIREARLRSNLSRFFSAGIADQLARFEPVTASFRPQLAAVMFIDVRGFTPMAERMTADELALFLSEYRRRMAAPVTRRGGVIDKFIGDGIMAVFGVPHPTEADACNAVQCGLDILDAADRWNEERAAAGLGPVEVGIGIHYGEVTAGALGDEQRLEFTVIGDTVNAANRIEELAGALGVRLLVSEPALRAAGQLGNGAMWEPVPDQALRGRRQPLRLLRQKPPAEPHQARSDAAVVAS
ncbi:adenylate/guanylate cyclase domain-containing protein [Microvirga arabica]|uniref:adenylate/guanylate cyclase domain-containing protein n=1 Tax=Microvirga arabica TaxID=1128671 RepID=UPI00193A1E01|nr:adenylate/guanylate cyclase domain-containing protein [Microvirga arabica]MBM1170132.1 adenylate/guanylate cyclase domain-containing protein [Microvirga arabica]